tara:strand:+ start:1561 stop:1803 length:243 start_codon:yes stop_codon:yes gene_type:complete
MRNIIFVLVSLVTGLSVMAQSSEYREGFGDGYCEGWKDVKGQYYYCPYAPYPPYPDYGKDHYRGGYNRGFKKGRRSAFNQ